MNTIVIPEEFKMCSSFPTTQSLCTLSFAKKHFALGDSLFEWFHLRVSGVIELSRSRYKYVDTYEILRNVLNFRKILDI